jgi:hypothetical protein
VVPQRFPTIRDSKIKEERRLLVKNNQKKKINKEYTKMRPDKISTFSPSKVAAVVEEIQDIHE